VVSNKQAYTIVGVVAVFFLIIFLCLPKGFFG
jgi:hypothetical protein